MRRLCLIGTFLVGGVILGGEIPDGVSRLLTSSSFEDRVKGQEALDELGMSKGQVILPDLLALYKASANPELRIRLNGVMRGLVISSRFGSGPGYVGIRMNDDQVDFKDGKLPSVQVVEVVPKSPADLAGLAVGDHIVRVDQLDFKKDRMAQAAPSLAFSNYVKTKRPGELTELEVVRDGKKQVLKATLALMPKELLEQQRLMGFLKEEVSEEEKEQYYQKWLQERLAE